MEQRGAVFLPAAGLRNVTSVEGVGLRGGFWSASQDSPYLAYSLHFGSSNLDPQSNYYRYFGFSLRLVSVL